MLADTPSPNKPSNGKRFALNDFIQHAVKNNLGVTTRHYLSIIFAGFEVWGGGLQLKQLCANVK